MTKPLWHFKTLQLNSVSIETGLLALGLTVWLILFSFGLNGYSGSRVAYAMFSVATGAMLLTGPLCKTSIGYLFLTVFLWLGFWLKLIVHTLFNYPFVEPVGSFLGGAGPWDEVLNTATVASIGVMVGRFAFLASVSRFKLKARNDEAGAVPQWYIKGRKCLWFAFAVISTAVIIINITYGVHQIGLPPRTILIGPMNAIISWMLNIGIATGIAMFVWWDLTLRKNALAPIIAVMVKAFLSSVSVLSRAVYIFHTIPQFWAVSRYKRIIKDWSHAKNRFSDVYICNALSRFHICSNYI